MSRARFAKRTKIPFGLLLGLSAGAISQLNGCTLVGYMIGSTADKSGPSHVVDVSPPTAQTIKPGTVVHVVLRDGSRLRGRYAGTQPVRREKYSERYAESRARQHKIAVLPPLGEPIIVTLTTDDRLQGEFLGFDYQRLVAARGAGTQRMP